MIYGKSELRRRLSDIQRKGLTNQQVHDLIDSLWRDPWSHRTSGFETEGGTDSAMDVGIEDGDIIFSIEPVANVFTFFQYRDKLTFCKKDKAESITFAAEEGLHVVYYDQDEETKEKILHHKKDPDSDDLEEILRYGVTITFLYYDSNAGQIIYQGDNRHGSWWNAWMRQAWRNTKKSLRKTGIAFTGIIADADGSEDEHAEFGILAGSCFHDDIPFTAGAKNAPANLPVFFFDGSNHPRIHAGSVNSLVNDGRLCYNTGGTAVETDNGSFVFYHIFFTDCTLYPHISVMGQEQYTSFGNARMNKKAEIAEVKSKLPHQNLVHVGSLIFETSDDFANSYKARIVTQSVRDEGFEVHIDFEVAEAFTYTCPHALRFTSMEHEQENAPDLSVGLDTDMDQYDDIVITPDATGLVTLKGIWI